MRRAARTLASRGAVATLAALAAFGSMPSSADAQTPAGATRARSGRSFELSGGVVFVGGRDLGSLTADLTSNAGGTTTLFDTESRLKRAAGLIARLGIFVTRSLSVEAGLRYSQPVLEVRITDDFEAAEDTTVEETQNHYLFEGSAVWHFGTAPFDGARAVPFISGGVGYLRELHEGDALVEEGVEYHVGGGVKWWLGAARRKFGVRAEAGLSIRDGGFDTEDGRRVVPVAGASLVYLF